MRLTLTLPLVAATLLTSGYLSTLVAKPDSTTKQPAPAGSTAARPDSAAAEKLSVVFVTPEAIASTNLDIATLGPWLNAALSLSEELLGKQPKPPRLLVQVTFRQKAEPLLEFSGQPKLSKQLERDLRKALTALTPAHTLHGDVCLRLQHVDQNAGNPFKQAANFQPVPASADQREYERFAQAPIRDEYTQLRAWARDFALPMLGSSARGADPKFAGVVNMGKLLESTALAKPLDVEHLTFKNPDYWRGVMEMVPGNAGITAIPALLFAANGEFDKAGRMTQYVRPFSDPKSLGASLLDILQRQLSVLEKKVNEEIRRGIELHDAQNYTGAARIYTNLLRDYPCSAWACYELFFSTAQKEGPEAFMQKGPELWRAAVPEIFSRDPLYDTQFTGERGRDMGMLMDRLALRILRSEKKSEPGEQIGRTAELAVRLECYGYAAHLYWLTMHTKLVLKESGLPEKDELTSLAFDDLLCRYLYCLEKLGCPDLKTNFKNDYTPRFAKFDEDLQKHRTQ